VHPPRNPLTVARGGGHTRRVHRFFRPVLGRIVLGAALLLALLAGGSGPTRADRAGEAASLARRASELDVLGTIEARRLAMECLERATQLDPARPEYQLQLGHLYYRMGFLKQARKRFEKVEIMDAGSADAHLGLGRVWRRDWLKYLDRTSLRRSLGHFRNAVRFNPGDSEGWVQLVPLLIEVDSLASAGVAAERALRCAPARPEARLAVAYTSYRLGETSRADSLFTAAIPSLPRLARERFEDIAPVASMEDTATLRRLPPNQRPEFIRRFWRKQDPDLASPENEAQLEYWSRVTQAYFLYFDPRRREWDERGEVYVRYGPPEYAVYNPVGFPMVQLFSTGIAYPLNTLVWDYPSLGMEVVMHDRLLSEYYILPIDAYEDLDPHPDPSVLERRGDLMLASGGRGVFPMLPPGARRRTVDGALARFNGPHGPILFGQVQTDAGPGDALSAEWVVLDSTMTEVARAVREPGESPCDPVGIRTADFTSELPPGHYQVGLTIRDAQGGRGVVRSDIELRAAPPSLTLSDAVATCGRPDVSLPEGGNLPTVHIDISPSGEVSGDGPLTVYFEIYDLRPDENGTSRFEYEATVHSAEKDSRIWLQRLFAPRRNIPEISAGRREEHTGSLRRQLVSIPVGELKDGRYRLNIMVRDLNADSQASTQVSFVKHTVSAAVPGPGS
jgi:GWxTD domain-containing protein